MRFKITLSYNGAPFCGWQIQPHAPSVQQSLNDALSTLLREDISVVGAGRTDTGVNAIDYVAHFDYDKSIDTAALKYKLNAILPPSIAIKGIEETDNDFHARFSARERPIRRAVFLPILLPQAGLRRDERSGEGINWHERLLLLRKNRSGQQDFNMHGVRGVLESGRRDTLDFPHSGRQVSKEYGESHSRNAS